MSQEDSISNWGDFDTTNFRRMFLYKNGMHADHVSLLKNNETGERIIKKRYRPEHMDIFYNEATQLYKLRDCPFVPKLLKVRADRRTMYMTYCGKQITLEDFEKYKDKIVENNKKLVSKWGIYHNDLKLDNICIRAGRKATKPIALTAPTKPTKPIEPKIYFIDFGWASDKEEKPGYRHKNKSTAQANSQNNNTQVQANIQDPQKETQSNIQEPHSNIQDPQKDLILPTYK